MLYLLLILFAVIFFELIMLLRISKNVGEIVTRAQESMHVLASSTIGDDERETCMRRSSAEILKATCGLAIKFLSIGLILYLLFRLTATQFPDLTKSMVESLVSPFAIVILTAVIACYALARKAILAKL